MTHDEMIAVIAAHRDGKEPGAREWWDVRCCAEEDFSTSGLETKQAALEYIRRIKRKHSGEFDDGDFEIVRVREVLEDE